MANFRKRVKPSISSNKGLRSIFSLVNKAHSLVSITPVESGIHNTELVLKMDNWINGSATTAPAARYEDRVIFYLRDSLENIIPPATADILSGTIDEVVFFLNSQFYDITIDDVEFFENKLRAKLNSLGYIGEVTINNGGSPSSAMLFLQGGQTLQLQGGGNLDLMGS